MYVCVNVLCMYVCMHVCSGALFPSLADDARNHSRLYRREDHGAGRKLKLAAKAVRHSLQKLGVPTPHYLDILHGSAAHLRWILPSISTRIMNATRSPYSRGKPPVGNSMTGKARTNSYLMNTPWAFSMQTSIYIYICFRTRHTCCSVSQICILHSPHKRESLNQHAKACHFGALSNESNA